MDETTRRAASHPLGDPLLVGRPVAEPRTRAPLDRGRAMRLAGAVGVTSLSVLTAYAVSANGHSRTANAAGTSSGGDVAESVASAEAGSVVVSPALAPAPVIVTTSSPESIPPSTTAPAVCTNVYTVIAGDSWTRIASRASIGVADLYAVNAAGPSTPLYPDQAVCLPGGTAVVVPVTVATTPPTVAATPTSSTKKTSTTVQPAQPATTSQSSSHSST